MGLNNGEGNKNGNSHHDPDDEKTPFTAKEEVNGNDIQTDKRESSHSSIAPRAEEDDGILKKLKSDAIYREKYFISLGIMWSFFVLVGLIFIQQKTLFRMFVQILDNEFHHSDDILISFTGLDHWPVWTIST